MLPVLLAVVLGAFAFVAPAMANPAQDPPDDCYPDGCGSTTTTEPSDDGVTCTVSLEAGPVDAEVEVTIGNVPAGDTVRVLTNGDEVARITNTEDAAADLTTSFGIPELPEGEYSVVAVGSTFTVTCGSGVLEVLGSNTGRGGDDDGGGGGALAFTGASILALIVLALALIAVGYYLVRRYRQGRATADLV